ncbi:hypothetical protein C2E25_11205 [Geothermobacter hydrogeniphilus]|uniref:Uncharacterized protein n=1 Tax=Geothermobacter hydrogeniphilus TaxID=1969733 RepID=A0A2K2H8M2_9BACT|nr:hypothetical protein [Geothermobacter hydrogeniphilus]PNU19664.1 hypothetical protein C2E25_11205 [Geothermobacter hydrogeniphilus]
MIVGFNHNFRYKGELYHVQTEDGGLKSPTIVTLLYCGGTILASQKTSYADITKVDNLGQVVEDLMKEQHKEMLRRLKDGEFDDRLQGHQPIVNPAVAPESEGTRAPDAAVASGGAPQRQGRAAAAPSPRKQASGAEPRVAKATDKPAVPAAQKVPPVSPGQAAETAEPGLDDIILSYLVGDDEK